MPDLNALQHHLRDHFAEFGGDIGRGSSEVLANLAISGIGTMFPDGWEIVPEVQTIEGVLFAGDGIEEGVSRLALIEACERVSNAAVGTDDVIEYRGWEVAILNTYDGVVTHVYDWDFPESRYGGNVFAMLRDVDLAVDVLRAHHESTTEKEIQP